MEEKVRAETGANVRMAAWAGVRALAVRVVGGAKIREADLMGVKRGRESVQQAI